MLPFSFPFRIKIFRSFPVFVWFLLLPGLVATGQTNTNMHSGTIVTCSANFYDSGGAAGNYSNNENDTLTFTSASGSNLRVAFSAFNTQSGNDILSVYDGADLTAPLLGQYSGTSLPPVLISSGPSLTFRFISNGSTTSVGWTAALTCPQNIFYSYQNGNWNNANVWTLDPSGTVWSNPALAVPGSLDKAVIKNARKVTAPADGIHTMILTVEGGGILDLSTFTGHTFDLVTGNGSIKIGSGSFPSGDFSRFTAAGGGTVEYNGSGFTMQQVNYFNLVLNLTDPTQVALMRQNNFRVQGVFDVKKGTFQINDNTTTSLTMEADSDLIVEPSGRITVGTGNVKHDFTLLGDFLNDGNVQFTTRTSPNFLSDSDPRVHVHFTNNRRDQSVQMNGPTVFYRIHCAKGVDDTYVLNLDASDTSNFKLYGPNNIEVNSPSGTAPNIRNNDALGLEAGTLRLGANIVIPALASSQDYTPTGDGYIGCNYYIDSDATLWIDGATVNTSYYLPPSNHIMSIMSIYGKLRITSGYLNDNAAQGIGLRITGQMIMEGGTVNTRIIRTSAESSAHRGAYTQTGGSVIIRRDFSTFDGFAASFHLGYTGTSFTMSGGTIDILQSTPLDVQPIFGTNGREYIFCVSSDPKNINISGGTITLHVGAGRNSKIATKGYFNNLVIVSDSSTHVATIQDFPGSSYNEAISALPLEVNKNFSLQNKAVFDAANYDVYVGGNFSIDAGSTYSPNNNTTYLNGYSSQLFTNSGTITSGLYNLSIAEKSNVAITNGLVIRNNLNIDKACYLQDMGQIVQVNGNLDVSGTHISQANGRIQLEGSGVQVISGNGSGMIGNLALNKSGGSVSLATNLTLNGNLRLANTQAIFDIGAYSLVLGNTSGVYDALTGTGTSFSANRMIRSNGAFSSGGLTRSIGTTGDFLFPLGVGVKYTPFEIKFLSAPATWGKITVHPVNYRQPFSQNNKSLNYFWKVSNEGFSGIGSGFMTIKCTYADADTSGNEAMYIPAVYNPVSWYYINNIADVLDFTNEIQYSGLTDPVGEFTAGEISAFGNVQTFYSRTSGNWGVTSTWTNDTVLNTAASALPGPTNPVIIRTGHTVTIPGTDPARIVGSLILKANAVLDLTTSSGNNFGAIDKEKVSGNGTIRISSGGGTASFPIGDFGLFLASGGGIVEYYTSGFSFTMPVTNAAGATIPGYNKLKITAAGGLEITLPDTDIEIRDSLLVGGAGIARMNGSSTRNILVDRSVLISGGNLEWNNNQVVNLEVMGDVLIYNSSSTLTVRDLNTAVDNRLIVHGNLVNNGSLNLSRSSSRKCFVTFTGNADAEISGNGTTTTFYTISLDKGSDMSAVLQVKTSSLTFIATPGLILYNGTFRLNNPALTIVPTTSTLTIPATSSLSVQAGTMNLCTGASDNNDLFLSGRLEILGGTMNIGNMSNTNNNDIEFSAAGLPEIDISGGALNVNGQIRRHPTIVTGALVYRQSGGDVTIWGKNRLVTRALLEVENPFSSFNLSGGNLFLVNGGGTTFGDLSLIPSTYQVTGGTIQFGTASTGTSSFILFAGCPLYNLSVYNNRNITLQTFPLQILNNLSIGTGTAFLNTNALNVSVGGNFSNLNPNTTPGLTTGGYRPVLSTQVTRFNGSSGDQLINGSGSNLLNFGTVYFSNTSSGTVNMQNLVMQVDGNAEISSGRMNNGNVTINLYSDFINKGEHLSGSGYLTFLKVGAPQVYQGTDASFCGNIRINNQSGLILASSLKINGILSLNAGSLYAGRHLLVLGTGSTVSGTLGSTRMIITNGALSDAGIRKEYAVGPANFTFPTGVTGKYTPVTFSVNSITAGTITIKPINEPHPGLNDSPGNELLYYWNVVSSGFTSPTVTSTFTYTDDVINGTESSFVTDRYYNYGWQGSTGTVNTAQNNFGFNNVNYIDGEYTAGASTNFISKPRLYSISSGNWSNPLNWSASSTGSPACNCIPDGNPVTIKTGHIINVGSNGAYTYSVDLPSGAVLNLGQTIQHNLGHVNGAGTIQITSTSGGSFIFPGGEYDNFFGTPGSVVEYTGNGALPPEIPVYQNVVYKGAGTSKDISAFDFKVISQLYIQDGYLNNSGYNRTITMLGNWKDDVTGGFIPGRGFVTFEGNSLQTITSSFVESFYSVLLNKTGGELQLLSPVDISKYLYLNSGYIKSTNNNLLTLSNQSPSVVFGAGVGSFIIGPVRKLITTGSYFNFPVGDQKASEYRYGPIVLNDYEATSNNYWQSQYVYNDPGLEGMAASLKQEPIQAVSGSEYWKVSGPVGGKVAKTIRWDDLSEFIPLSDAAKLKLRVVEWNGLTWQKAGDIVDIAARTVSTDQVAELISGSFTLGLESLSTAHITGIDGSICNDGSQYSIPVNLTGDGPWSLTYSINGANFTTVNNIGSSSYSIVISSEVFNAISGPGVYVVSLEEVKDNSGLAGVVYGNDVQVSLLSAPTPSISGKATVNVSEAGLVYSTPAESSSTFSWTVNQGSINSGQGTNEITINWGNTTGAGQVQVQQTISSTGCSKTTVLPVNIVVTPKPEISGTNFVCSQDTVLYSTPAASGHTYSWSVTGGSFTTVNGTNAIKVNWSGGVDPKVWVVENSGTDTGADTIHVTVNPLPVNNNLVMGDTICQGLEGNITIKATAPGLSYVMYSGELQIGDYVPSLGGGDLSLSDPGGPPATATYVVHVWNTETGCRNILVNQATILVQPLPSATFGVSDSTICSGANVIFTASGGTDYTFLKNDVTVQSGAINTYSSSTLNQGDRIRVVVANTGFVCLDTSRTIIMKVDPIPAATLSASKTELCEGETILFSVSGGQNYDFYLNSILVQSGLNPNWSSSTLKNNDQVVVIASTITSGCSDTSNISTLTVHPVPIAGITVSDSAVCSGTLVTFTGSGGNNYDFLKNDISVQNGAATSYSSTSFANGDSIKLIVTQAGSTCTDTSRIIPLKVDPVPVAVLLTSDNEICQGENVIFTASGGQQYDFYRNDTLVQSGAGTSWNSNSLTDADQVKVVAMMLSSLCSDTSSTSVMAVHTVPLAGLSVSDSTVCSGTNVVFTGSGGSNYNFLKNGISIQDGPGNTYESSAFANGDQISLIVTGSGFSCTDTSRSYTLSVDPLPVALLTTSDNDICTGEQVTFQAFGGQQFDFYRNGNLVQTGLTSKWSSNSLSDNDQVQVIVSMLASGCADTSTLSVLTVHPKPAASLLVSDSTVCSGASVQFSASGGDGYEFFVNNISVQSGSADTYNSNLFSDGDRVFVVVTSSGLVCGDTSRSILLSVDPTPSANLLASKSEICGGENIAFSASGGQKYDFYLNGALKQSTTNANWSSSTLMNGDRIHVITTMLASGCSDTSSGITVVVHDQPMAGLTSDPPVACEGRPITFTATGGALWSFVYNGSTVQNGNSDAWILNAPSDGDEVFSISSGADGYCHDTSNIQVLHINSVPVVEALVSQSSVCSGDLITVTLSGATTYSLYVDGNLSGGPVPDQVLEYQVAEGIHNLIVVGVSAAGCSDTTSGTLVEGKAVPAKPQITASGPLVFVEDDSVILSGPVADQYQWSNNSTQPSITVRSSGVYTLQVISNNGCSSPLSDAVTVKVNSFLSKPQVSPAGPIKLCEGESAVLTATVGEFYEWSNGEATKEITVNSSGMYSLVTRDHFGHVSPSSDTVEVRVFPNPLARISDSSDVSCFGASDGTATVMVTGGSGSYSYNWTGGQNTATVSGLSAGNYTVNITDLNSCQASAAVTIREPDPLEVQDHQSDPACPDFKNGELSLVISGGTPPYSVGWSNDATSQIIIDLDAGSYTVTIQDSKTCQLVKSYQLNYLQDYCLTLYGMFTPNGDGHNDTWEIDGADAYPDMVIEIFDRWGKRVFFSRGYQAWDGKSEGKDLPMDSYHYVITLNSGRKPIIGNVTIVR